MFSPTTATPFNSTRDKILRCLSRSRISPAQVHQIQAQLILQCLHSDTTIAQTFISASQSLNLLASALTLFTTHLHRPHPFICNSLIRAFSHSHSPQNAIFFYTHMLRNSIPPNNFTFPFLLKCLADSQDLRQGRCVHTHVTKSGLSDDIYVLNSLLSLYASCGHMDLCRQMFDEMPLRDVVSWTALITGYRRVGKFEEALIAFETMHYAGVEPNHVTMVNALAACASSGALEMGCWIHDFIRRKGWELDVILGTSLVDMYGKCGRVEEGLRVFSGMEVKNAFTWNALIKGLALAKSGVEAVKWFLRMEEAGIKPDEVTLLGLLSACSHSGLVQMGWQIFDLLIAGKYGFAPSIKHYASMVDLLARAGHLSDALDLIKKMAFEPTKAMWGALLAGSKTYGNVELSELAARKLVELAPDNGAYYVLLSNLYAEMGRWSDLEPVRRLMKARGLEKDLGSSLMELESTPNGLVAQ